MSERRFLECPKCGPLKVRPLADGDPLRCRKCEGPVVEVVYVPAPSPGERLYSFTDEDADRLAWAAQRTLDRLPVDDAERDFLGPTIAKLRQGSSTGGE